MASSIVSACVAREQLPRWRRQAATLAAEATRSSPWAKNSAYTPSSAARDVRADGLRREEGEG